MEFSLFDRLVLSNQYRILEALYPDEAADFARDREAIEHGYEYHYSDLCRHIYDRTFSLEECKEVLEILTMFSALKRACEALDDMSEIEKWQVEFGGFDGNNETRQLSYARYYCDQKDNRRFPELGTPVARNSHAPTMDRYRRMLREWYASPDRHDLTKDDVRRIGAASVHPANR